MTRYGYTLMTEQSGPNELVGYAVAAERAGFDFEVISDHYFPWLDAQGHAPYAWSVLGAVAQATERVELMTYVTCPTIRYHPAVVAQKAATVADPRRRPLHARSRRGGEPQRARRRAAAGRRSTCATRCSRRPSQIIRELFDGEATSATPASTSTSTPRELWDLPEQPRADRGRRLRADQSVDTFAPLADAMIAVEPEPELVTQVVRRGGGRAACRKIGQMPICWGPDRDAAVRRAHDQFRWFAGGWKVNADLPGPAGVRGRDASSSGPRTSPRRSRAARTSTAHVEAVRPYVERRLHPRRARAGRRRHPGGVPARAPSEELLPALRG